MGEQNINLKSLQLSGTGLSRLEDVLKQGVGGPMTYQVVYEKTGVDDRTARKIRNRKEPVQISSLQKLFHGLKLILVKSDYEPFPKLVAPTHSPKAAPKIAAQYVGKLLHNVPSYNRIFTGRQDVLEVLHNALQMKDVHVVPVPQVLTGMGGVGKSQIATEYIRLYHDQYNKIFWILGETLEGFNAQLAALAPNLVLSILPNAAQSTQLLAVKNWFATNFDWLMVVDNAANLPKLKTLFPSFATGHLLITTRETVSVDFADCTEVSHLDEKTGALLLLRRAEILLPKQDLHEADPEVEVEAKAVSAMLGGLALALDQAGAYMQQRKIAPGVYRRHHEARRQKLHWDYVAGDHPTVTVTFSLALEQVEKIERFGSAAAELGRMCAFLAPDIIPDAVFLSGANALNEPLAASITNEIDYLNVCEAACRYALLRRVANPPGLLMHRLAQEVLRDTLNAEQQKTMAKHITMALSNVFPVPEYNNWLLCETLMPHAFQCETYIDVHAFSMLETGNLLMRVGCYLAQRARYIEAERLLKKVPLVYQQALGDEHKSVATAYDDLAGLYLQTGRAAEAVPLLKRATEVGRKTIGEQHPDYAVYLENLGWAYRMQGDYINAEPLYRQALAITEQALGEQHRDVATRCNNLGLLYDEIGRDDEAILLYERAIDIDRNTIGIEHPDHAVHLINLATLHVEQSRPSVGLSLLIKAHTVLKQAETSQHPNMAACLFWLGQAYNRMKDRVEALRHFSQALTIYETVLPPEHPKVVATRLVLHQLEGEDLTK